MDFKKPDTLDKTVTFLAKRDGIDKVLKIIRYVTKLLCVTVYAGSSSELAGRLQDFEASIGTSRKAYRLGKFLADINALRKTPLRSRVGLLELIANSGEGTYYFVEQLTWLVKAGLLHKRHAPRFSKVSAWAELVGYVANVTLNALRIATSYEREMALTYELLRLKKEGEGSAETHASLAAEVAALSQRRVLRSLAVIQDLADSLLALNDIRDGKGRLNNPALLCVAGLASAFISFHKNWPK